MRVSLTAATLEGEVLPQLGVALRQRSRDTYALDKLLEEIVLPQRELAVATVFKRRFAFTVNGCMTELSPQPAMGPAGRCRVMPP